MEFQKKIEEIKSGKLSPIYMVQGKEDYLQNWARQVFLESVVAPEDQELNVGRFNMEEISVQTAIEDAESVPFFGDRRLVMIDKPYFLTGEKEKSKIDHQLERLQFYLENPLDSSVVVFFAPYEKLDSRKKIVKQLKKVAVLLDASSIEEKDVRVGGMDSTLDSEFSNYDYITTYKSTPLPETLTAEEEKNLFEEYNKSKDKSIKEKIILANLKLVSFINYKIAMTYNIDINELNSYGYEKLIMLVDRFDPSKGYRFSTLAYTSIKRMVYANLPKILGYQHLETYKTFMEASKKMREMYDENGISEEVALSEIIDLIKRTEEAYDID